MKNWSQRASTILASALLSLATNVGAMAATQQNVLFVLDASNSMWGQISGKPKIQIAREVLKDLAGKIPSETKMGLVAYGHRFDRKLNECDDMELMNPVGHFSADEADNAFDFIKPKGQTPIARTLLASADWLQEQKGQQNTVVLISDGLESCDGDPCTAAKALNDAGVTTKIHVVGFDLTSEQRAKLDCIAKNGNGNMYAANNADSLSDAMNEVRVELEQPVPEPEPIVVAQAPAAPEPPKLELVFEDEFEGEDLGEGWEITNPNPDRYITEEGELLIVAGSPASSPALEEMENVIHHSTALPKGDWDVEVKLKLELQQGTEAFYFGVRNDHENWLAAGVRGRMAYGESFLNGFIEKNERGKLANFDVKIDSHGDTSGTGSTKRWATTGFTDKYGQESFVLVLSKRGRSYSLSAKYADEGHVSFKNVTTENLKMLRGKKNLFVGLILRSEGRDYQGEGAAMIDYVKVTKVSK
ncbi:MAG: VWA domain-containing protein [Rhizobiaceae bacterium]